MGSPQKFDSVFGHTNFERSLSSRANCKKKRAAALADGCELSAA